MYKNLLIATDGSKLSEKAVSHAIDLASRLGSQTQKVLAHSKLPVIVAR